MLEVRMDRLSQSVSEKKVANPTMKMVEEALSNAGFRDGIWVMKAPHRTRKRGAERFRALRMDGSGIRVRCKPSGNDTCYEWTLCPPPAMDQDEIFSDLCAIHSSSLKPNKSSLIRKEEAAIIVGLFDRVADAEPAINPAADLFRKQDPEISEAAVAGPVETAAALKPRDVRKSESLDISGTDENLCSDFALDRALMAFHVCSGGKEFVKRGVLSEGLIRLLGIEALTKRSPVYGSVKGAMRALMMALCGRGYMERVMYGQNSTNGYRITADGEKRLGLLKGLFEMPTVSEGVAALEGKEDQAEIPGPTDAISILKGLIAQHEEIGKQMKDLAVLIGELENETENDSLMVSGIVKALGEKLAEKGELDKEIARLESKLGALREGCEGKASDMRSLKDEMERLRARRHEIESRITSRR